MTSPPERTQVRCPACEHEFEAWRRPSWNEQLDGPAPEHLNEPQCPSCGERVALGVLVVGDDGVWRI